MPAPARRALLSAAPVQVANPCHHTIVRIIKLTPLYSFCPRGVKVVRAVLTPLQDRWYRRPCCVCGARSVNATTHDAPYPIQSQNIARRTPLSSGMDSTMRYADGHEGGRP